MAKMNKKKKGREKKWKKWQTEEIFNALQKILFHTNLQESVAFLVLRAVDKIVQILLSFGISKKKKKREKKKSKEKITTPSTILEERFQVRKRFGVCGSQQLTSDSFNVLEWSSSHQPHKQTSQKKWTTKAQQREGGVRTVHSKFSCITTKKTFFF
jgi:hypothetical protein